MLQEWQSGERNLAAIGRKVGVQRSTVQGCISNLRIRGDIATEVPAILPPVEPEQRIIPRDLKPEDVGFVGPQQKEDGSIVSTLRAEIDSLRHQLTWATHTDVAAGVSGGTMTINISDWHLHDRNHLPTAIDSCEDKTLTVIRQFRPRKLQIIENGDIIPGRGIYREQVLESVIPKAEQQVSAAAMRFVEFVERCAGAAQISPGDIEIRKTPGNHDYTMSEPTSLPFVYLLRMFRLKASFVGKYTVWNLADEGVFNALFFHGYGHSKTSPSSPSLIDETIKLVLKLATQYEFHGANSIQRVSHGHVHWLSLGLERAAGLVFDVTGGFQRFERVKQGYNERPTGWICYASPAGSSDVIPIPIRPDTDALEADMTDPILEAKNHFEAHRCIDKFEAESQDRGIAIDFWKKARETKDASA